VRGSRERKARRRRVYPSSASIMRQRRAEKVNGGVGWRRQGRGYRKAFCRGGHTRKGEKLEVGITAVADRLNGKACHRFERGKGERETMEGRGPSRRWGRVDLGRRRTE
jgi:hypothetical protein